VSTTRRKNWAALTSGSWPKAAKLEAIQTWPERSAITSTRTRCPGRRGSLCGFCRADLLRSLPKYARFRSRNSIPPWMTSWWSIRRVCQEALARCLNGPVPRRRYPDAAKPAREVRSQAGGSAHPQRGGTFRSSLSEEQKTLIRGEKSTRTCASRWRAATAISGFACTKCLPLCKASGRPDARLYASVFPKVAEMPRSFQAQHHQRPRPECAGRTSQTQLCQFSVSSLRDNDRLRGRNRGQRPPLWRGKGYHARRIVPLQRNRKLRGAR